MKDLGQGIAEAVGHGSYIQTYCELWHRVAKTDRVLVFNDGYFIGHLYIQLASPSYASPRDPLAKPKEPSLWKRAVSDMAFHCDTLLRHRGMVGLSEPPSIWLMSDGAALVVRGKQRGKFEWRKENQSV